MHSYRTRSLPLGLDAEGCNQIYWKSSWRTTFRHEMNKKQRCSRWRWRKPVAEYIKIPPYFSVRWTSATIDPMYLKKKGVRKRFQNVLSITSRAWTPTCCHRGCFPFFWIWHIPLQRPPSAPRSPVISMKFSVFPWSCVDDVGISQVFNFQTFLRSVWHLVDGVDLATGLTGHPRVSQDKFTF